MIPTEELEEIFAPISTHIRRLEQDLADEIRYRREQRDKFEEALQAKDEEIAKLKARPTTSTTVLLSDLARIFELAPPSFWANERNPNDSRVR